MKIKRWSGVICHVDKNELLPLSFFEARAANFSPQASLALRNVFPRSAARIYFTFLNWLALSRAGGSFTAALYQLIIHFGPIIVIVM
jgi:hypothetical protein